jgi:hypothetical protein
VAWWAGSLGAVLGSDGVGELGEGLRDPVPQIDIKAKSVMAAVIFRMKACPTLIIRAERSRL